MNSPERTMWKTKWQLAAALCVPNWFGFRHWQSVNGSRIHTDPISRHNFWFAYSSPNFLYTFKNNGTHSQWNENSRENYRREVISAASTWSAAAYDWFRFARGLGDSLIRVVFTLESCKVYCIRVRNLQYAAVHCLIKFRLWFSC